MQARPRKTERCNRVLLPPTILLCVERKVEANHEDHRFDACEQDWETGRDVFVRDLFSAGDAGRENAEDEMLQCADKHKQLETDKLGQGLAAGHVVSQAALEANYCDQRPDGHDEFEGLEPYVGEARFDGVLAVDSCGLRNFLQDNEDCVGDDVEEYGSPGRLPVSWLEHEYM